jgi:hypothetical protein
VPSVGREVLFTDENLLGERCLVWCGGALVRLYKKNVGVAGTVIKGAVHPLAW